MSRVRHHDRSPNCSHRRRPTVLAEYCAHYNTQRPHQALQLRPPHPESAIPEPVQGRIRRRPILGGDQHLRARSLKPLLSDYSRVLEPDKVEAERELIRAQKEAAREEERARRDFERQKEKLLKEQAHNRSAYNWLLTQPEPDRAAVVQLRGELDRLGADIATVEARAANTRAGYVYVISNIGSFGDRVVKIGMTRRLETMDRVRELGDASVPFRFDVHALVFSNDAVGLEGNAALAVERVNKVNQHREFFRTTPARVRELLAEAAGSHLLEFTESAEALEWRASGAEATLAPLPPEPVRADHPSEDDSGPNPDKAPASAPVRQLQPAQIIPLSVSDTSGSSSASATRTVTSTSTTSPSCSTSMSSSAETTVVSVDIA